MKLYDIYIPELGTYVKFKVLPPSALKEWVGSNAESLDDDDYVSIVIEHIVYNLNTEIRFALEQMTSLTRQKTVNALYNCCIMLNPVLDIDLWIDLAYSLTPSPEDLIPSLKELTSNKGKAEKGSTTSTKKKPAPSAFKITKSKMIGLGDHLSGLITGQDQAIGEVVNTLKRSYVGLGDNDRPVGVFLFAGSSGVGKTHLARELHKYLFSDSHDLIRIDCGEYQHKHENQKLIGSPPGFVGHEEGGFLTNAISKNPNTVVLLDEVEKAHPDIWNTFLRIFDEGLATDSKGNSVSFRNTVFIMTTNLGNSETVEGLTSSGFGFLPKIVEKDALPDRKIVERNTNKIILKRFSPELMNRINKIIVFNHLSKDDFSVIAELELTYVANKLSKKGIRLEYSDGVVAYLVENGVDTVKGARGMAQARRDGIENALADFLMDHSSPRGSIVDLDYRDEEFIVDIRKPEAGKSEKD